VDPSTHLFWITGRAAGITALVLASLSVAIGLLMSMRGKKGPDLRIAHEALSLATLAAIGVHALSLLADPWLKPGVAGVLAPFAISYRPVAVAAGIIAAYGLGALGLSYYARGRIGPARWRRLHRWTALFWVMAVVHGFTSGSDAGQPWFVISVGLVIAPALILLAGRLARSRPVAPERPATPANRKLPPRPSASGLPAWQQSQAPVEPPPERALQR
jgi:DMSO/TMAO reductase YedYZ heme-binding membrane subunit